MDARWLRSKEKRCQESRLCAIVTHSLYNGALDDDEQLIFSTISPAMGRGESVIIVATPHLPRQLLGMAVELQKPLGEYLQWYCGTSARPGAESAGCTASTITRSIFPTWRAVQPRRIDSLITSPVWSLICRITCPTGLTPQLSLLFLDGQGRDSAVP